MFFASLALIAQAPMAPLPPLMPPEPMFAEIWRDPITDEVKAFATQQDGLNRIAVGCDPTRFDGLRVTLTTRHWLGRGEIVVGARGLTHRFDDARPQRMLWLVRDRSARLVHRRNIRSFLRWMAVSETLAFRTRNFEEDRLDLSFRLTDVRGPLVRVLEACGENRMLEQVFPDA